MIPVVKNDVSQLRILSNMMEKETHVDSTSSGSKQTYARYCMILLNTNQLFGTVDVTKDIVYLLASKQTYARYCMILLKTNQMYTGEL